MTNNNLHPQVVEFATSLTRLIELLNEHEAVFWAEKIAKVKRITEKSDGHSITLFLGMFGDAGSLNDLVLNAPSPINDKLHQELNLAYKLAKALK